MRVNLNELPQPEKLAKVSNSDTVKVLMKNSWLRRLMSGKVIAVANEKGGVGKTTCAVQLAHLLSDRGQKVCLVDNDPSGDATTSLLGEDIPDVIKVNNHAHATANTHRLYQADAEFTPLELKPTLHLMGATDVLSVLGSADLAPAYAFCDSIDLMLESYDVIIIDCPPSFGIQFTAAMLASKSGGVLIPVVPDELSVKAAKKLLARITQMTKRNELKISILGVIANKIINNPTPVSVSHYLTVMKQAFGDLLFDTQINQTVKISDAISLQENISTYAARTSKASKQMESLATEVLKRLASKRG
jgi:chromosome partitioning protein